MAIRSNTTEWGFESNKIYIQSAGWFSSSVKNITIPETSSRIFRSVQLQVGFRDSASAASITAWQIEGHLNGAPTSSGGTVTNTLTNTGDHQAYIFTRDLTGYFSSSFTGSTHQFLVSGSITGLATIGHSAKLTISYEYNDNNIVSGPVSASKTVRIPLESSGSTLSTLPLVQSLGTGSFPNVPLLDTYLPENGKIYDDIFFEIQGNDAGNAVTTFQLQTVIDSGSANTRHTCSQALNSAVYYYDIQNVSGSLTTSQSHFFKANSTVAARFTGLGAILHVTYRYSVPSSSQVMNSLVLNGIKDEGGHIPFSGSVIGPITVGKYYDTFLINEPGVDSSSLRQSGIVGYLQDTGGIPLSMSVGTQLYANRNQVVGSTQVGPYTFFHRADESGSSNIKGINMQRGYTPFVSSWCSLLINVGTGLSGLLYLNYVSNIHPEGPGAHNHSIYKIQQYTSASTMIYWIPTCSVSIPETNYFINGNIPVASAVFGVVTAEAMNLYSQYSGSEGPQAGVSGGLVNIGDCSVSTDGEVGYSPFMGAKGRDYYKAHPLDPNVYRQDITKQRTIIFTSVNAVAAKHLSTWVTYTSKTYDVNGIISNYPSGDGSGLQVDIIDTINNNDLYHATTIAGGIFSSSWYENVNNLMAICNVDSTHKGVSSKQVAGSGTFNINLAPVSSGGETSFTFIS